MTQFTARLTQKDIESLREIAKQKGFIIGRGNFAHHGSIRKLLVAIASGKVVIEHADTYRTRPAE